MDIQGLMRQAQEMQKKMQKVQEELANAVFEGSAGGGMVIIKVSGDKVAKAVTVDPALLNVSEKEVLEDLLLAAFNDALKKVDDASASSMNAVAGNLKLPGGFKL